MTEKNMLRSMTGFGRGQKTIPKNDSRPAMTVVAEARSVNLKGLEVKLRVPRCLQNEESVFVKQVKNACERGRIDLHVELQFEKSTFTKTYDEDRVSAVMSALHVLATNYPQLKPEITAGELFSIQGILLKSGDDESCTLDEECIRLVHETVIDAIQSLQKARAEEGALLFQELQRRRNAIHSLIDDISARIATAIAEKQQRLQEKLQVFLKDYLEPQRLVAEMALLAERLDVTEELARLRMHIEQLDQLCVTKSSGRRIDFLCQEFLREANTTASKCADANTAHLVVELKAEIERLREQAQNVE